MSSRPKVQAVERRRAGAGGPWPERVVLDAPGAPRGRGRREPFGRCRGVPRPGWRVGLREVLAGPGDPRLAPRGSGRGWGPAGRRRAGHRLVFVGPPRPAGREGVLDLPGADEPPRPA